MKQFFRFFSLLALAAVTSLNVMAADWNIPLPQASQLVPGDTFAIRNVGMQCFIHSGEAYGTQATVNKDGHAALANGAFYWVCPKVETDNTFGEAYTLYDNSKGNATDCIWRQPADANMGTGIKGCFVDAKKAIAFNQRAWTIKEVSTNTYTIQTPATVSEENNVSTPELLYVEGEFLGVQTDHPSTWAESNAEGVTYGLYYDVVYADAPEKSDYLFSLPKGVFIIEATTEKDRKVQKHSIY